MRRRFLASIGGGLLGFGLALPLKGILDVAPSFAFTAGAIAGVAVGYILSTLFDVFVATPPGAFETKAPE